MSDCLLTFDLIVNHLFIRSKNIQIKLKSIIHDRRYEEGGQEVESISGTTARYGRCPKYLERQIPVNKKITDVTA